MISLDLATMSPPAIYKLMIGTIVPRPIAFVSTVSAAGVGNLAPFSFFNGVSSDPPCVVISITRKNDGSKKDTLRNIEETRQFVVNTVSDWMVEPMNQCSGEYPYGVDEMQKVGLTPLPSAKVSANRVKESAIHLECELVQTVEIGNGNVGSATLVIGRIVMMHFREDVYEDGKVNIENLKPVARLAGAKYALLGEIFELARPQV
jgi:flavin reductase (DIM6/NTAB) family NADH-FMN oxidoreductase RutF